MGIPHFYKYVATKHNYVIKYAIPNTCTSLFVDLNCAVHRCASQTLETPENPETPETPERKDDDSVIDRVVSWIKVIFDKVQPTSVFYIALDGVPPKAKMVQQRSRRYISSVLRREGAWDSCCVTPGTAFMRKLAVKISKCLQHAQFSTCARVVFSPTSEFGEGEHKIFDWIEKHPEVHNDEIVIYGADADLIMLSMKSSASKPYVLRESLEEKNRNQDEKRDRRDRRDGGEYEYIDVGAFRNGMCAISQLTSKEFVALCFLLGNDFVPSMSFLRVRDHGIEYLLKIVKELKEEFVDFKILETIEILEAVEAVNNVQIHETHDQIHEKFKIHETVQFHFPSLIKLFSRIARDEDVLFAKMDDKKSFNSTLLEISDGTPFADMIQPRRKGWMPRYYEFLFPNGRDEDTVKLARKYLESLVWTSSYYFDYERAKFSDTCYHHAYSPLATDVVNYLRSTSIKDLDDIRRRVERPGPLTQSAAKDPAIQLLMVLPPSSSNLLSSKKIAAIMNEPKLRHFYPRKFRIATYMKWYLSDCHAILPVIDADVLLAHYGFRESSS